MGSSCKTTHWNNPPAGTGVGAVGKVQEKWADFILILLERKFTAEPYAQQQGNK